MSLRILVLTTSTNNVASFIGSLAAAGYTDVAVLAYDRKWHEAAFEEIQKNPSFREQLQNGSGHIRRDVCAMDDDMLNHARLSKPDAIVYISARWGDFIPLNETLGELNQIAPLIHFLSDGADPPWWSELEEFDRRQTFSLTVNIDGCHIWPGNPAWPDEEHTRIAGGQDIMAPGRIRNALTLLTPVDTRYYPPSQVQYIERPYPVGYAGNQGGHFRSALVQRMGRVNGFAFRERDMNPQSYPQYADFLRHCRISISTAFTGSGAARQVKGRVLESGFAGAALLEWENDATSQWFTPRHEYMPYGSIEECAELAEWLAGHPKIAGEMAKALQHRVETEHHPRVFWQKVFSAVGK